MVLNSQVCLVDKLELVPQDVHHPVEVSFRELTIYSKVKCLGQVVCFNIIVNEVEVQTLWGKNEDSWKIELTVGDSHLSRTSLYETEKDSRIFDARRRKFYVFDLERRLI